MTCFDAASSMARPALAAGTEGGAEEGGFTGEAGRGQRGMCAERQRTCVLHSLCLSVQAKLPLSLLYHYIIQSLWLLTKLLTLNTFTSLDRTHRKFYEQRDFSRFAVYIEIVGSRPIETIPRPEQRLGQLFVWSRSCHGGFWNPALLQRELPHTSHCCLLASHNTV